MDTIAAIASAAGEGGIGVIRISGRKAAAVLQTIFKPAGKGGDFVLSFQSRRFVYGHVLDPSSGEVIDEAMAVLMRGPKTYTAEDVAEVYCHGSVISLRKTLELILRCGARPAERGEFTKRAFLNGRLDLSQAEAVMELIGAKTDRMYGSAVSQLEGALSGEIKRIRDALRDILVEITVNLDYPDEDIEELTYERLISSLMSIGDMIQVLKKSIGKGRILREGLHTVIIGKPNVGKSTLMNALLREQRAIVTDIPGTTRDTIEELLDIKGIPVKLVDTAGIRQTEDQVESIGIKKAKEALAASDLVLCVIDGAHAVDAQDESILRLLEADKTIVLLNKTDLGEILLPEDILRRLSGARILRTALQEGKGVSDLEEAIYDMVYDGQAAASHELLVTNARHADLISKGLSAVGDSIEAARSAEALDFVELDVRRAYELLGEIIGETASDDVIDEVFARFCLGK